MNYDGKAIVKNCNKNITKYFSSNGACVVISSKYNFSNYGVDFKNRYSISSVHVNNSPIISKYKYNSCDTLELNSLINSSAMISTTKTLNNDIDNLSNTNIYTKDKYNNFNRTFKISVSDKLIPTNLDLKDTLINSSVSTKILDLSNSIMETSFNPVSVSIYAEQEVSTPPVADYGDMSFTIQKDNFIEIILPESVIGIGAVPDGLTYYQGVNKIKGTITKSGDYTIKLTFGDGSQNINIHVPVYQRIL